MLQTSIQSIRALIVFTVITGVAYPLIVTGFAQLLLPYQANGSLILHGGKIVGSELIGQYFDEPQYFWGRPSATSPFPYNASASSGSNLGPTNPALAEAIRTRIAALKTADPGNEAPIPVDLVTASDRVAIRVNVLPVLGPECGHRLGVASIEGPGKRLGRLLDSDHLR